MNFGVSFAPLVPDYCMWAALAASCAIAILIVLRRSRGALARTLALALFVLALANPSITREDRDLLTSVAVVVVDKSPSQEFSDRTTQTEEVRAALSERLSHLPGLDVRFVEAGQADGETDGTRLFAALSSALSDVPHDRVAGAILITDGRVHDVPGEAAALGFAAPVHALITGHNNERDRRVVLVAAPRFGIVGQSQTITFRIDDQGGGAGTAQVTVRRDGETIETLNARVGTSVSLNVQIPHAGPNIIEIEASALENELTEINNRAVVSIDGVRDKLRVLLVSGEPHAGERTWRNLLKSDASVDLVHFTILPAEPSGRMTDGAFRARLTELGKRHPVTRGLEGADEDPPHWSHWFRLVDTRAAKGTAVMQGPGEKPLLLLSREGEGRVALLLSDHIWLWARGFEGGGPHIDLLRRLSHWLMKEPDLEEEALRLAARGRDLTVQRQTMSDTVNEVTLTAPSGKTRRLTLSPAEPGVWRSTIEVNELGLWRATDGTLKALANVGPPNPREFTEVTSTTEVLAPLAHATGGDVVRVEAGSGIHLPRILAVRSSDTFRGDDWLGLRIREASVVRGIGVLPIFAGLIGLLLLIGSLAITWLREGR